MSSRRIIPALADLTQDIAGPIPVSLLQDWAAGKQNLKTAESLLSPFRIDGTVVCSDTSGLSRLSREKDLLYVLSLVSTPKEILHALGSDIGGRAIGTWVADNTEMYYPAAIDAQTVLDAMWESQHRINQDARIKVGLSIHNGTFYEIGGGLYGPDAAIVERLAEHYAAGGEILISSKFHASIRNQAECLFEKRGELDKLYASDVYLTVKAQRLPALPCSNTRYPYSYTDEFFQQLLALKQDPEPDRLREQIYRQYQRVMTVVFLARQRTIAERDLASMLDDLLINAVMDTVLTEMEVDEHVVESGGGLAVLSFDAPQQAYEFARAVRVRFEANNLPVMAGIDEGPVLFFQKPNGFKNIVGEPINIVSKISEDAGQPGKISITQRAAQRIALPEDAEPFQINVSNIQLSGVMV